MRLLPISYVLRRLRRQGLVGLSVLLGMTLSVALGIATPLASNALAPLGLRATLQAIPPTSQNIQLTRNGKSFGEGFRTRMRREMGNLVAADFSTSYTARIDAVRSQPSLAIPVRLRTQGDLAAHSTITGHAPQPHGLHPLYNGTQGCTQYEPIEAILGSEQLQLSSLAIGDQLCIGDILPVIIVGTFEPKDPTNSYWQADQRPLKGELISGGLEAGTLIAVLMIDRNDFDAVAPLVDQSRTIHVYRMEIQSSAITIDNLATTDAKLRDFRTQVASLQPRTIMLTSLDRAIATFDSRLQLLQSALVTLLIGMATLAVVYVVLVGTLATEQQIAELAVLRSRGGSTMQVLGNQIAQALLLAIPGAICGAGLGIAAVFVLARTELFQRLRGQGGVEIRWTQTTTLLGGGVLLLAIIALIWAARPGLQKSLVTMRQDHARPPKRAGALRYQTDAIWLLLAGIAWWQMRRYGGALMTTVNGTSRFNYLLLAAPILMLIAGALLFLRIFPWLIRGLSNTLSRQRGLVAALSTWQLARNPLPYSRLVLLVTLTVGLGVYSRAVSGAIAHEQVRQALDRAGADVRVELPADINTTTIEAIERAYGAETATLLTRIDTEAIRTADKSNKSLGDITLMGVDGAGLAPVLEHAGSDDQAFLSTLKLMSAGARLPRGLALPPDTRSLSIAVSAPGNKNLRLYATVAGLNGIRLISLGRPPTNWTQLQVDLPADLQEPRRLQSLVLLADTGTTSSTDRGVLFDDLTARTPTGDFLLDGFEKRDTWEAVGLRPEDATVNADPHVTSGGTTAVRLAFAPLSAGNYAVLRYRTPAVLPVYSNRISGGVQANPGQTLHLRINDQIVDATIASTISRLPGLTSPAATVLLTDRSTLQALLTYGIPIDLPATELRLSLPKGHLPKAINTNYEVTTKAAALLQQAADPLGNGVSVILMLGFACAIVLSILGVITYTLLTIQGRRLEWAVLRALGISAPDLLMLIGAEQLVVLGGGTLAGMLVGIALSLTTSPFTRIVTQSNIATSTLPDWPGVLLLAGGLIGTVVGLLALLLAVVQRRGMLRELRLGES